MYAYRRVFPSWGGCLSPILLSLVSKEFEIGYFPGEWSVGFVLTIAFDIQ